VNGCGKKLLTYCAIRRLGVIPVVGRKVMEPIEDILVRHACQTGRRVGPGNESGGGGGHVSGGRGEVGMRRRWI